MSHVTIQHHHHLPKLTQPLYSSISSYNIPDGQIRKVCGRNNKEKIPDRSFSQLVHPNCREEVDDQNQSTSVFVGYAQSHCYCWCYLPCCLRRPHQNHPAESGKWYQRVSQRLAQVNVRAGVSVEVDGMTALGHFQVFHGLSEGIEGLDVPAVRSKRV